MRSGDGGRLNENGTEKKPNNFYDVFKITHRNRVPYNRDNIPRSSWQVQRVCPIPPIDKIRIDQCRP